MCALARSHIACTWQAGKWIRRTAQGTMRTQQAGPPREHCWTARAGMLTCRRCLLSQVRTTKSDAIIKYSTGVE